jgi:hypothetical protein
LLPRGSEAVYELWLEVLQQGDASPRLGVQRWSAYRHLTLDRVQPIDQPDIMSRDIAATQLADGKVDYQRPWTDRAQSGL